MTLTPIRRSVIAAAGLVLVVGGGRAEGAATTKFGAWALGWYDSAIPLMLRAPSAAGPQLDVRQERQYAGFCNRQSPAGPGVEGYCATMLNTVILPFAAVHRGHHYVLGDEPDQYSVSAAEYAAWYRTFTSAVLAVDPTARFSPAGFAEPNVQPSADGHFTTYAENFYNAYVAAYGVAPPVNEWRFNLGLSPNWQPLVDAAVGWSTTRGAKVTLTIGYTGRPATENVVPELQQFLAYVAPNSQVAHVAYFVYNPQTETPALYNHALTTPGGALTPEGQAYMQYALAAPSSIQSSSPSPDFNGDGFADFADQWRDTNQFWIHYNNGVGGFGPGVGPYFPGHPASGFSTLAANFVGDSQADYADVHVASRQAWIHARHGNGSFDAPNTSSGYANLSIGAAVDKVSSVEILTADFNGDGKADFAKRELATGLMWVYLNNGQNPAGFTIASGGRFVARTMLGPDWRVLVGDFTGDGLADYADQYVPLGIMWIHRNIGGPSLAMDSVNWRVADQVRADANTIVGDFTGDGWCDYADEFTSNGNFFVHRNQNATVSSPNGGFQPNGQSAGFGDAESPWAWWRVLNAR